MNLNALHQQRLVFSLERPVEDDLIRNRRLALSRPAVASEAPFQQLHARMKLSLICFLLATAAFVTAFLLLSISWWLVPAGLCGLVTASLALGAWHLRRTHTLLQALRHEAKGLRPVSLAELTEIARLAPTDPALQAYVAAVQHMNRNFVAADLYLMKRFAVGA